MACDSCGARRGHLGGCPASQADESLARRRSKKRAKNPGDRTIPPGKPEFTKQDCSKCKGAKVGPFGKRGKVITCPECRGTGTQMREKPK